MRNAGHGRQKKRNYCSKKGTTLGVLTSPDGEEKVKGKGLERSTKFKKKTRPGDKPEGARTRSQCGQKKDQKSGAAERGREGGGDNCDLESAKDARFQSRRWLTEENGLTSHGNGLGCRARAIDLSD